MTPDKVSSVSEELRPCPFCGSDDIGDDRSVMFCASCEAVGPRISFGEPHDQRERWNTRSSAPRTSEDAAWLRAMAQHTTRPDWEAERLNRIANTLDCSVK